MKIRKIKTVVSVLLTCAFALLTFTSCKQEETRFACEPIDDLEAYYDTMIHSGLRQYNLLVNPIKYEIPEAYKDRFTDCNVLRVEAFEGGPHVNFSYMGEQYELTEPIKKKFSYYTTEDIVEFVGLNKIGYQLEREKFTIGYCAESKEIVSFKNHAGDKSPANDSRKSASELIEIAKKIINEDYNKNIDFSKYVLYSDAIAYESSAIKGVYTRRFYWRRYIHGVCVHQIRVDLRWDGVLQSFDCPPAFDERAMENIPNLTEEQYGILATSFIKEVYESSGQEVTLQYLTIDHNNYFDHEEIYDPDYLLMPTMRLVYLNNPQRMLAVLFRFQWVAMVDDGRHEMCEQDFYIPVFYIED